MVAVLFLELPSKNKEAAVGDPRRLFLCVSPAAKLFREPCLDSNVTG
jgi:hypothetical protein